MSNNIHHLRKTPKHLTPDLCARLQTDMLEACTKIAKAHGLVTTDDHAEVSDMLNGFEFSVRIAVPMADGSVYEPEKAMFEALALRYGLKPEDYGKTFEDGHEQFRITGIEPRRLKYPISVERIPDRRKFKLTAEMVARYLEVSQINK